MNTSHKCHIKFRFLELGILFTLERSKYVILLYWYHVLGKARREKCFGTRDNFFGPKVSPD